MSVNWTTLPMNMFDSLRHPARALTVNHSYADRSSDKLTTALTLSANFIDKCENRSVRRRGGPADTHRALRWYLPPYSTRVERFGRSGVGEMPPFAVWQVR